MRKIITTTFVTLNGVMQAPGGPEEDTSNGFASGGWVFHYWDDMMGSIMNAFMNEPFDLLLGWHTYEIFASYWPNISDHPVADNFNACAKYVVSSKPMKLDWQHSFLVTDDVPSGLRRLKQGDGNDLWVHGSGKLIQTLLANDLVDRMHIWTFPVTTEQGKSLFDEGAKPTAMNMIDSKVSTTGVIIATYEPAGELRTGSVA